MASKTYDAIVVGGGPGGYPCAIRLGQLGQKVACVEKDEVGGVCLNWGCIPSKALISAAHLLDRVRHAGPMGLRATGVEIDVGAMQDWKTGIVKRLTGGVRGLLRQNGADLVAGTATLTGPGKVDVALREGGAVTLEARAIVLATGASTIELPAFPFDGKQIFGAKEAVGLRAVPGRLLVIGGGAIGLELGMVYQKLGAELTVVEMMPTILPGTDPDCAAVVDRRIRRLGGKVHVRAKAIGFDRTADGALAVRVEADGKAETVACDAVLVAVGMRPNSSGIGLDTAGVTTDERGFVPTDRFGRTNVPSIYAVGDVSGPPLLAHKASKEGEVVAEVIAGRKAAKDWTAIAAATFTDPEVASVGMTEAQARDAGHDVMTGRMPFSASGRAMANAETDGFVKIVADAKTHRILGVHIVGAGASDLVSEGALAVEMAAYLEDVGLTIHPHPTLGEAVMIAANHALGQAIDIPNR